MNKIIIGLTHCFQQKAFKDTKKFYDKRDELFFLVKIK